MEMAHHSRARLAIFAAVVLVALAWAFTTQHVWEDFYITYRSSKNLATGHGLVFNEGDRLHTFTSPLGVLLPALACVVTGNSSDEAAIWVFRVMSAAALGGAVLLLLSVARRFAYGWFAAAVLAIVVAIDGKTIDFTTNGMETGFLLLFVAYMLWASFVCTGRRWLHLGLAWGGIMWTRPDGFLYIGLFAAGVFFFNDAQRTGLTRRQWLKLYLQAGLVCTVVYLPWLEWAWWYYGTPVPHTIAAKGGVSGAKPAWGALKALLDLPLTFWKGTTSLDGTFLPSYYQMGGWPQGLVVAVRWVAVVLAFVWVLPFVRVEVRAASFAFCGLHTYLTYFPFFPFPWYLPGTTLFAAVVIGGLLAQALDSPARRPWLKPAIVALALVGLGAEGWLTWQMRREMTIEEIYSATGTRRAVGEWLHDSAKPGDTVFMEPLGHIGYFSGLKTYDYPGLSSREMVAAIRKVGTFWPRLINYLEPDWVVLRPQEYYRYQQSVPWLFGAGKPYDLAKEFNHLPQLRALEVPGRPYVEFDAHLMIFRREYPKTIHVKSLGTAAATGKAIVPVEQDGQLMYRPDAGRTISVVIPPKAKQFWVTYGVESGYREAGAKREAVDFRVELVSAHQSTELYVDHLEPVSRPEDRKIHYVHLKLPAREADAELVLRAGIPAGQPKDALWGEPDFVE